MVGQGVVGGRGATQAAIVCYLRAYPWSTTNQIAGAVNRSASTVRKYLREMEMEVQILRDRPAGGGHHGNAREYALIGEEG